MQAGSKKLRCLPQIEPGQLTLCRNHRVDSVCRLEGFQDCWIGCVHPARVSAEGG